MDILDDRKSLLIAFLAISDQYATFICFHKMAATILAISDQYATFICFHKMAATILAISDQYATFFFLFTKWLPASILDDRKSLLITFLAISDQYATFLFEFFFKIGRHICAKTIGFFHYVLSMAVPNMKLIGDL